MFLALSQVLHFPSPRYSAIQVYSDNLAYIQETTHCRSATTRLACRMFFFRAFRLLVDKPVRGPRSLEILHKSLSNESHIAHSGETDWSAGNFATQEKERVHALRQERRPHHPTGMQSYDSCDLSILENSWLERRGTKLFVFWIEEVPSVMLLVHKFLHDSTVEMITHCELRTVPRQAERINDTVLRFDAATNLLLS